MFKTAIEAEQYILAKSAILWKEYLAIYNCGSLPPIKCIIKKSRTAGYAYYKGQVEFNLTYFCTHDRMDDLVELIAHELAHIIQFRLFPAAPQAHGPEFRSIMQSIGFKGDTYHYMNTYAAKSITNKLKNEAVEISADDF